MTRHTLKNQQALWTVAIIAILFLRCRGTLFSPELLYEDATELFGYYFNQRNPFEIFKFYNGYIALLPNLVAYLAHLFSPTVACHLLTWFPFTLACIAYSGFISNSFSRLVPDTTTRGITCLLAASLPISKNALLLNTSYSIWSAMILLALLYLMPVAKNLAGRVLQYAIATLLIWSNPISLVLLLIPACQAIQEKTWQRLAIYSFITMLYLLLGIDHESTGFNTTIPVTELVALSVSRSVLEALIGTRYLFELPLLSSFIISVGVLLGLHLSLHRQRVNSLNWHALLILTWVLPLAAIASRGFGSQALVNPELTRYFYPARLILIICMVNALSGTVIKWPATRQLTLGLVVAYLILNINGKNTGLYAPQKTHSDAVRVFINQVENGENALLDRGPNWSVTLNAGVEKPG